MGKLTVDDATLASKVYGLANKGFKGTVAELAAKLEIKSVNPTSLGNLSNTIQSLSDVFASKCKVDIGFKRSGNNKYLTITKGKGYKQKSP